MNNTRLVLPSKAKQGASISKPAKISPIDGYIWELSAQCEMDVGLPGCISYIENTENDTLLRIKIVFLVHMHTIS